MKTNLLSYVVLSHQMIDFILLFIWFLNLIFTIFILSCLTRWSVVSIVLELNCLGGGYCQWPDHAHLESPFCLFVFLSFCLFVQTWQDMITLQEDDDLESLNSFLEEDYDNCCSRIMITLAGEGWWYQLLSRGGLW